MVEPKSSPQTVSFIDDYCQYYQKLFPEVRSFTAFKYLQIGLLSELKRKSLPEIAKLVGLKNSQSLHHFFQNSPWSAEPLKLARLQLILKFSMAEKLLRSLMKQETQKQEKLQMMSSDNILGTWVS